MANLCVARFVPGDARKIIFRPKIFEPNVPDERTERLDGVDFITLRADEAQAQILVGVLRKTRRRVGRVVVAGVFERLEADIAQWDGAPLKRPGRAAQRSWLFV